MQTEFKEKLCSKCKCCKSIDNFIRRKDAPIGWTSQCKECRKEYVLLNKDKITAYSKKYNARDTQRQKRKKYAEKHRKESNRYTTERRKTDLLFKLAGNVRSRTRKALFKNQKVHSLHELDCSIAALKKHLESQFKQGMSWDNYGKDGWHIDHIMPLITSRNIEEFYKLCHYTNLRPLWAADNLSRPKDGSDLDPSLIEKARSYRNQAATEPK